ncbi:MAG TPA: hypothetical protein VJI68_00450 [Candidatus Nanoarchaeia archaeon]|nr:hypothetical protein [Candidatus Nanoarchaeia archaeon]
MPKKEIDHKEKKKLLNLSEISLILDTYEDIFSDFDPRPFTERALSDDFLLEAKKAARDKNNHVQLNFLIPKNKRDLNEEKLIKQRLKQHFEKHYSNLERDKNKMLKRGIMFIAAGVILMLFASLVLLKEKGGFLSAFLIILLEPGGWFLFWEGLYQVIFESKKMNPNLHFYGKMKNAEVSFLGV